MYFTHSEHFSGREISECFRFIQAELSQSDAQRTSGWMRGGFLSQHALTRHAADGIVGIRFKYIIIVISPAAKFTVPFQSFSNRSRDSVFDGIASITCSRPFP